MRVQAVVRLAIACLFLLLGASAASAQERMKVLLDTDIGTDIDDAWALGLLIVSPQVELVGVTISDGDTAARAKVACKLLHVSGRGEVPVAVGRATPVPEGVDYQFSWAEDFTTTRPVATPAADFIVETLRKQPGPDHAAGGGAAAEHRRRAAEGAESRAPGQAHRLHERVARRQRVVANAGGRVERRSRDR